MNDSPYGRLHFQDLATFDDSPRNIVEEALELLARFSNTPQGPAISDWARITECIHRGTLFSLTAESAAIRAFLRFDPAASNSGDYEIRVQSKHRNEKGRVLSVVPVDQEALCKRAYAMLAQFPIRYLVITSAHDRQGTQRLWRIGILSPREVSPGEPENDEIILNA